jgi:predicted O-methyltransferase YrrM
MKKGEFRYHWLTHMIRYNAYTLGAEIGAYHGKTTRYLLQNCPKLRLYAVDKWEKITPDPDGRKIGCENWDPVVGKRRFDRAVRDFSKRLIVLRGDSVEMASQVPDESLDFVFIDADHRYEAVKADIIAWVPKLKEEGVICGHDINHPKTPGVYQAVKELIPDFKEAGVDHVWFARKEDYYVDRRFYTI